MQDVAEHKHCKVCGNLCDPDVDVCSTACETKRAEAVKTRRNYTYLMYGAIGLLVVVLLLTFF